MRKKFLRNLLAPMIVTSLIAIGSVSPVDAQSDGDKETIRVLILENLPPQFVSTPDGPSGLAVEVVREVARRVSLNIEFVTVKSWKDVYAPLENRTVDVLSSMGVSKSREKIVDFTDPYEVFDIKLFIRQETTGISSLDDLDDLDGRLLGVQATNVLTKDLKQSGKYRIKTYRSFKEAFLGLLSGEVDAVPAPTEPFLLIARTVRLDSRIRAVGPSLREVKRAMAVPKGQTELRDLLNKGLAEFKRSDEYRALLAKWYGTTTPYWTQDRIQLATGVTVFVFALIMLAWRYSTVLKLNKRIRESEERFALDMRGANDGLWDWDLKTNDVYYSPRWCEMLGYTPEEIEPSLSAWERLVNPRDKDRVLKEIQEYVEGTTKTFYSEFQMQHKNGSWVSILARAFLVNENGEPVRIVGTHIDITRRKLIQAQLIQSSKLATLGEMSTGMAHELNQPLNIIQMAADSTLELASDDNLSSEALIQKLERIKGQTTRAAAIINHMRIFGRADSGERREINLLEADNVNGGAIFTLTMPAAQ